LFEQVLLFLRQLLGDREARHGVEVALPAAGHVGHALAAQLETRADLRARRNLDLIVAGHRRDRGGTAQRQHRVADGQMAIQVIAFAMKRIVLLDVDDDVEIARGAAGGAVLAFAVEAQPLAGCNAGGNLRGDLSLAADAAGAAARLAGLADDLAGATARRARARDRQEALLEAQLS
jgi:hypothetical protein